jgi:hypothetical protein
MTGTPICDPSQSAPTRFALKIIKMNSSAESDLVPWVLTVVAVLIMGIAVGYSSTDSEPDSPKPELHTGAVPAHELPAQASRLRSSANGPRSFGRGT